MEETAFFANLTLKTDKPVVFTGSMKPASALSADGPLNLLNAVRLAGSPKAQGKGVLVALNGAIHGARDVVKTNSVAVETFKSPNSGPLGYIIGDQIEFLTSPPNRTRFNPASKSTKQTLLTSIRKSARFFAAPTKTQTFSKQPLTRTITALF